MRGQRMAIGTAYGQQCPPGFIPASPPAQVPQGCVPAGGYDPTTYTVADVGQDAARRWWLNFEYANVPAATQVTITQNPQALFRPERLVIPSIFSVNFTVDNIIIGNRPQAVATGSYSAVATTEVAVGVGGLYDTAEPGVQVQLQVTNISGQEQNFYATFFGATVVGQV